MKIDKKSKDLGLNEIGNFLLNRTKFKNNKIKCSISWC